MKTTKSPLGIRYLSCVTVAIALSALATERVGAQGASAELGKPIAAAQEAINQKQWTEALRQIKAAQTIAKTPRDTYAVDTLLLHVLDAQKKYDEAEKVQARMLASGHLPPDQIEAQTKNMARLYFSTGKYKECIAWAGKVLEKNADDRAMSSLTMNSYFQLRDYKKSAAVAAKLIATTERKGQAPDKNWLRTAQHSYLELGDEAGERRVLAKLVKHYQDPGDWEALLVDYADRMHGDAMKLAYYRLMFDAGALKRPDDYVELAQLAMDTGVGIEARSVMEQGLKKDHLKSDKKADQDRYARVLAQATGMAAEATAMLAKLESEAITAADGLPFMQLGHLYMSMGAYAKAVGAFQKGMAKGVYDPDQARIDIAIAYAEASQRDRALKALRAVDKNSKWAELAELWSLRV